MKNKQILILFFILISFLDFSYGGLRSKINKGNTYFKKNKYEDAISKYRDAMIDDPESKELHYNLGTALYKTENYEEALKEFEKSTYSKDIKLQAKAYYNMGNCNYKMGDLLSAIQFYKKALELDPNDEDAKYNIEFIQRKIKENMDKQQDQQSQQTQQKKQQEKSDKNKDKKENKEKEESKSDKEKEKGMSKEDAQRLLNKFEEDEKQAQKERRKIQVPSKKIVEYDW